MAIEQVSDGKVLAKDLNGQTYKVSASDLLWRPGVYGIVIENDKILVCPQFGDKFAVPGGGVDLGEDLETAVIREVKEETGIDVEVVRVVGVKSSFSADTHSEGKNYHSILIFYECRKTGGEISTDGFDEWEKQYAGEARWVPLAEFESAKLASTVDYKDIVKKVIHGD